MVCPLIASSPTQCTLGYETADDNAYATQALCKAKAQIIYESMARDLYSRGASLRVSCVKRKVIEQIKNMPRRNQTQAKAR